MKIKIIIMLLFTILFFIGYDINAISPNLLNRISIRASNPNLKTRLRDIESILMKQDLRDKIHNSGLNKKFKNLDEKIALTQSIEQGIAAEIENHLTQSMNLSSLSKFKIRDIVKNQSESHIRLDQYYMGLRVFGGDILVHFDADLEPSYSAGNVDPDISLTTITPLTKQTKAEENLTSELQRQGLKEINLKLYNKEPFIIYDERVAYQYDLSNKIDQIRLIVDAESGEILQTLPLLLKQSGTPPTPGASASQSGNRLSREGGGVVNFTGYKPTIGNYYLYSFPNLWGIWNLNNSSWSNNSTNNWGTGNRPWVSAARNTELILNYVRNTLNRNGIDNTGQYGIVNYPIPGFDAYWDISEENINIGSGETGQSNEMCALDIIAHEFCHGLQQHTSNLNYIYESAALNEAYSDVFACLVEFTFQPDGRNVYLPGTTVGTGNVIPGFTQGAADWLIGEDAVINNGYNAPLRDFRNPHLSFIPVNYGTVRQPSRYSGTYWFSGPGDYGGAHYNGGVLAKAFYFLSEGTSSSGSNDGVSYDKITGIGWTNAGKIAMDAILNRHVSTDVYTQARQRWIESANSFGMDVNTVAQVWSAVGVGTFQMVTGSVSGTLNYDKQSLRFGGYSSSTTTLTSTSKVTAKAKETISLRSELRIAPGSESRFYIY